MSITIAMHLILAWLLFSQNPIYSVLCYVIHKNCSLNASLLQSSHQQIRVSDDDEEVRCGPDEYFDGYQDECAPCFNVCRPGEMEMTFCRVNCPGLELKCSRKNKHLYFYRSLINSIINVNV